MLVELGRGDTFVPTGLARTLERSYRGKAARVASLPPLAMAWAARSLSLLPEGATDFMNLCDEVTVGR